MALTLVRILGWLVIVHGLSHAVLPMRGFLGPDGLPGRSFGFARSCCIAHAVPLTAPLRHFQQERDAWPGS